MLPVILQVGDLSGACGWDGNEWRRLKVTTEGALVLQTYGIVFDWTATSNVTYVDVTGLDINSHWGYWFYVAMYNPQTSSAALYLYVNGDYTNTNYYNRYILSRDTTVVTNIVNGPNIGGTNAGERTICTGFLALAPGGVPYALTYFPRRPGSSLELAVVGWTYTVSVSNITSLRFASSVDGGIGAGSKILIYRLK
jgi:hypothetical protein